MSQSSSVFVPLFYDCSLLPPLSVGDEVVAAMLLLVRGEVGGWWCVGLLDDVELWPPLGFILRSCAHLTHVSGRCCPFFSVNKYWQWTERCLNVSCVFIRDDQISVVAITWLWTVISLNWKAATPRHVFIFDNVLKICMRPIWVRRKFWIISPTGVTT